MEAALIDLTFSSPSIIVLKFFNPWGAKFPSIKINSGLTDSWSIALCIATVSSVAPSPVAPNDLMLTISSSLDCNVLVIGEVALAPVCTDTPFK